MMDGIILVDKPQGMSSHDVVEEARRLLEIRRVGHAGTLDPAASGLLIILVGGATKKSSYFSNLQKEYEATLSLGVRTDTGDSEGRIIQTYQGLLPDESKLRDVFKEFLGEIEQIPPMSSAVNYKGERLYKLHRRGITVERRARRVKIYQLEPVRISLPEVDFRVVCSKGTYIRTLGEDIGERLGCGGYISFLCRKRIGSYSLDEAITLDERLHQAIRPI